ncbi:MAG: protein kinase, partial [Acidobacteria bacterium]|nr:protein kinase [Acidobacteriota bacterium]
MSAPEPLLDSLARAILDDTPVDWADVEARSEQADRPLLAQLRLLATLRNVGRTSEWPEGSKLESWGRLRVFERIGRGAFGEVYRAWDPTLDREVALKLLPMDPVDGASPASIVIEEGRLLARVRHPNVVTIYGAERIGQRIGLWMELVNGRTLEQTMGDGAAFTDEQVVGFGRELCKAVAAVHDAGLLHRDIKMQNVMVAGDGRVVLMDFGTGRQLSEKAESHPAGTPLYLAPEVLSGQKATIQSDIYSIGVVLYRLLTGGYPVQAKNLLDLRRAHADGERHDIRSVRPVVAARLARVVERAIDPDPRRRHPSAEALGADLAAIHTTRPVVLGAYAILAVLTLSLIVWLGSSPRTPPLAGRPVIAVLPFKNLSAEPGSDYFADGLTDEIIRNLAVIDGMDVRSQTSSFFFKSKERNLRDIGDQLGANLVVEGSVQRDGRQLRINGRLVQVAGDVVLWSERFDRPLEDVFAIQDEISRAIVNKLRLTVGRGQRRYQTDVATYDLYLRARQLVERRGTESAQQAAQLFEQVIAKDPAFAPAHAGLSDAYALMSIEINRNGLSFEEALSRMRPAAVRAIELDPLLSEAHAAMGMTYSRELQWENARNSFRRAIELNPSLTQIHTRYSTWTLLPLGRLDEAETLLNRALETDPLSLAVRRELANLQIIAGRYDEAIANLKHVYAVDPGFPY